MSKTAFMGVMGVEEQNEDPMIDLSLKHINMMQKKTPWSREYNKELYEKNKNFEVNITNNKAVFNLLDARLVNKEKSSKRV